MTVRRSFAIHENILPHLEILKATDMAQPQCDCGSTLYSRIVVAENIRNKPNIKLL
jgi:hypothetical protein